MLVVVAGCDDGDGNQPATMDLAVEDGPTDAIDTTVDGSTGDMGSSNADDVANRRGDGESGDACESHWDCRRGLHCDPNSFCRSAECTPGFRFDDEDWACLFVGDDARRTAIECEADADCADGAPCRINACQEIPPCDDDADCPTGQYCLYEDACMPCDPDLHVDC